MIFSIKHLLKDESMPIKIDTIVTIPEIKTINPNVKVSVIGTLTNNGKIYNFLAKVKCEIFFECHSCLKSEKMELNFNISEVYTKNNDSSYSATEGSDEVFIICNSENKIDFTQAIKNSIILNLPMKMICSENCKGLCYICGKNLNEEQCDCKKDYINPKFEKFLKIFNSEKEV